MIFCLKIEEFLLLLTCCFKFTTNHESQFASTCKMCFPNTCKTVLCSGNQFPVKRHIFLFFNFVPLFMELPVRYSRSTMLLLASHMILISSHTDILHESRPSRQTDMHTLATYQCRTNYFKCSFFPQTIVDVSLATVGEASRLIGQSTF